MDNCTYKKGKNCTYYDGICKPESVRCKRNLKDSACIFTASVTVNNNKSERVTHRSGVQEWQTIRYGENKERQKLGIMDVPEIRLFKGYLNIPSKYVIDALLNVYDMSGVTVLLFVAYNTMTKKIYMLYDQLKYLTNQGYHLRIKAIKSDEGTKSFDSWDERNEHSILSLYGYKVGKKGLSKRNRENILAFVYDNEILKAYEIISHLQGLISERECRKDIDFSEAIFDWEHDIRFITEYASKSDKVKHIRIDEIIEDNSDNLMNVMYGLDRKKK